MSRFRTHWLALFGGVTLLALSLSTAFAAKPEAGDNVGSQVSAFVHSLQADGDDTEDQAGEDTDTEDQADEDTDTETEDTETEDDTNVEADAESAPSDHGQCVAAVAQDPEAVGPPNDNHGGAVSEAARVTCWETGDESAADASDTGGSELEGTSSEASNPGHGHGKGHKHR